MIAYTIQYDLITLNKTEGLMLKKHLIIYPSLAPAG